MLPNSNIETVLPGETLLASTLGNNYFFESVLSDSAFCSFAARTLGNTGGLSKDRAVAGIYGATDAKCLIASGSKINGPFDAIYVSTTSDPIRVVISVGV